MKKTFLFLASLLIVGGVCSQTLPDGMITLLPEGVTPVITGDRREIQQKNLVVAGEKSTGYKAFFAATDATNGEELWVTNGTVAGTKMVKDINPGTSSSDVNYMARFNDKVVFSATDGENGYELWISDGTEAGTYMVKNIHEYDSSEPRGFTQVNENQFVFGAKDYDSQNYSTSGEQWWLWVSDGTEEGTKLIYECDTRFPGVENNSFLSPYMRVGRKVFFKADKKDGSVGEELWVTDGSAEGTSMVKDINTEAITTGTANSALDIMVNYYNEKLFCKAYSIESSNEPWASDGTEAGTYQIYDSNPTFDDSGNARGGSAFAPTAVPYNEKIYFRGYTPETGYELASTNLDQDDFTIFDINQVEPTSDNNSYPDPPVEFDGVLMFCAATGFDATLSNNYGGELHYTDGETITMQSDLATGIASDWVKELIVVSGSLYWWNESTEDVNQATKLFRIDNKSEFPERVVSLNSTSSGDQINTLRNLDGDLLFTSSSTDQLYLYHYRKDGYDAEKDSNDLDIEYRTREEIASGLSTIQTPATVVVYPNPTSDRFNFNVSGKVTSVKIFNMMGVLVKQETQLTTNSVNVTSLAKGIYEVVITSTEGAYVSILIVK